jgi:hypothetical protein
MALHLRIGSSLGCRGQDCKFRKIHRRMLTSTIRNRSRIKSSTANHRGKDVLIHKRYQGKEPLQKQKTRLLQCTEINFRQNDI